MNISKNYYQLLNVDSNSSLVEIKKAFRILSKKYHPDKNLDSNTHDLFTELNNAYEILGNPDSRKQYDLSIGFGVGVGVEEPKPQTQHKSIQKCLAREYIDVIGAHTQGSRKIFLFSLVFLF